MIDDKDATALVAQTLDDRAAETTTADHDGVIGLAEIEVDITVSRFAG